MSSSPGRGPHDHNADANMARHCAPPVSAPRFWLAQDCWPAPGEDLRLDGPEAAHCRVLRLRIGEAVALLDGRGTTGLCHILAVEKHSILLRLDELRHSPRPRSRAVMALALSKAVRRGFFMEKAVELGAAGVWLWQGDHSQGRLAERAAQDCLGQMIAGAKQCGNPWLPEVRALSGIDAVTALAADADQRILPWEMQEGVPMLLPGLAGRPGLTVYVIGPEGGFSRRELDALASAAFTPVSLGGRVLRCETAATLCLGLHWWASQLPGGPDFRPTDAQDAMAASAAAAATVAHGPACGPACEGREQP